MRSVAGLSETSTMRASPPASIWVRAGPCACPAPSARARGRNGFARQQCAGGGSDVGLSHQAFAHQEGRHADLGEPREIGGRKDAALADHQPVARNQRRQRLAGRKRGLEGAQVAVVDADHRRPQFQGAIELGTIMDLDQHVHAVGRTRVLDILRRGIVERGHDDQDAIGAMRARFRHLIGVEHEILAQHGQIGGGARGHHEIEMTLEGGGIGQHREAGRAAGFIGLRKDGRIEIGADQPLGGRGLLHLRDQRVVAARVLALDRTDEAARRGCSLGACLDLGERLRALGGGDLLALVGLDPGEDIRHRVTPSRWRPRRDASAAPRPRRCRAIWCRARRLP